jgi:hypothetical protein
VLIAVESRGAVQPLHTTDQNPFIDNTVNLQRANLRTFRGIVMSGWRPFGNVILVMF